MNTPCLPAAGTPILELVGVSAHVGPVQILDQISLTVGAGQVVALVGPSGAGKSTIASLVLDEPAPGLTADGTIRPPRDAQGRLRVGYLPQHAAATLNPSRRIGASLGELVALHRPERCRPGRLGRRRAVLEVLAEAAFVASDEADVLRRYPWEFSGGQRQRLALAQVLTTSPALLVLDEPTAGLDPAARAGVVDQILRQRDRGLGVLLITHDPWVAAQAADTVVSLEAGRVVATGAGQRAGPGAGAYDAATDLPGAGEATPPAGTPLVEFSDVTVDYGAVRALSGVDLRLDRGEVLGVMGASGSGKSTLARVLVGLRTPDAGQVRLDGVHLPAAHRRTREQLRRVQYVWQESAASFVPHRCVLDQCADTAVNLRRQPRAAAREEALGLLDSVGVTPAQARRVPRGLSGGQLQRVALVRALMSQPEVLVCDEVTTALDADHAAVVAACLDRYRQRSGAGLLIISHDQDFLDGRADRRIVIEAGQVAAGT